MKTRLAFWTLSVLFAFLAWQTKQEAITLPLFIFGCIFIQSRKNWKLLLTLSAIPLAVALSFRQEITSLYAQTGTNQQLVTAGFEQTLPAQTYIRTYVTSIVGYYLPRFILPDNLSADPEVLPVANWYSPEFLFSCLVIAVLLWLSIRIYASRPLLSFAIVAALASPLLAYAAIPLADVVLEHRAYIPGLCIAFFGAACFTWMEKFYPEAKWFALTGVIGFMFNATQERHVALANNVALWKDAIAKAPNKVRPHFNLGQTYQQAGDFPKAIVEYANVIALKPETHAAYSNLGSIYLDQATNYAVQAEAARIAGRITEAEQFMRQYQAKLDDSETALLRTTALAPKFPEGWINLSVLYLRRQNPDKALWASNQALALDPQSAPALFNLAEAMTQKGQFKESVEIYRQAAALRPDIDYYNFGLANAQLRAGNYSEATLHYRALLDSAFRDQTTLNLALALHLSGKVPEAITILETYLRAAIGDYKTKAEERLKKLRAIQ